MSESKKHQKKSQASTIEDADREKIESLSLEYPAYGARRLLPLLRKKQIHVSETTVYNVLRRKGLQTREKRLLRLEELVVFENQSLNDEQWQALESHNPCLRELRRKPPHRGRLLFQNTRLVWQPAESNPVFLHAVVDTHCLLAFGLLSENPHHAESAEFLESHVLPVYHSHQVAVDEVLTLHNPSLEAIIDPKRGSFPASFAKNGETANRENDPVARSNGFVDYFFLTAENEFFRHYKPALNRYSLDNLRIDFSQWLDHYNHERLHHGFPIMGSTPLKAFVQSIPATAAVPADSESPLSLQKISPPVDPVLPNDPESEPISVDSDAFEPAEKTRHEEQALATSAAVSPAEPVEFVPVKKPVLRNTGKLLVYGANVSLIVLIILLGINGVYKISGDAVENQDWEKSGYSRDQAPAERPVILSESRHYRQIWKRDLFQTSADKTPDKRDENRMLSNLPKAENISLSLVGTVVFSEPDRNYAIVYDGKSDNQLLLHEGDKAGSVKLTRILRNKVIIDDGNGEQLLAMEDKTSDSTPNQRLEDVGEKTAPARSVRRVPTSLRRKYLQNRLRRIYRSKKAQAEKE